MSSSIIQCKIKSLVYVGVRCSIKSSCVDSHFDKRWLSSSAWECIRIPPQFVNPVSIAVSASIQVKTTRTACRKAQIPLGPVPRNFRAD